MNTNFDWTKIPTYKINVKDLSSPYDLSLLMKNYNIDKYLYMVMFKGIVLKFGMSADNSRNFGERIYRQIGHCKSWGTLRLTGSSGSDWRIIEEDFESLYGYLPNKDFMTVKLWDVTNYPFITMNSWHEVNAMENVLIEQYVKAVGEKPLGNINDEANVRRRPAILKETWNLLFEFDI
jgi:hypothetical protein